MKLAKLIPLLIDNLLLLTEDELAELLGKDDAHATIISGKFIPGIRDKYVNGVQLGAILSNCLEVMPTFMATNQEELETLMEKLDRRNENES